MATFNTPLRILSKAAAALIGLGLVVVIVYLVVVQYNSQIARQQAALQEAGSDCERRATAVGYFFSEQLDYMGDLAQCRELSAYFENKALGMSMEYGLRASSLLITERFDKVRRVKRLGDHPLYKRIVFLDANGRLLNDSRSPDYRWQQEVSRLSATSPRGQKSAIYYVSDAETNWIIISVPSFFKERYVGQVMGWIPFSRIYTYFFEPEKEFSRVSDVIIYHGTYIHVPPPVGHLLSAGIPTPPAGMEPGRPYSFPLKGQEFRGKTIYAILAPVRDTPFSLMAIVPPSEQYDFRSPKQLLYTTIGLALFIVGGIAFLLRLTTNNALLQAHLEETRLREQAVDAKNRELAAEIRERQLAEAFLQKERDFVESLFETAQVIMLVLDTDGRVERFNSYLEEISGYHLEEVRGKDVSVLLPEELRDHPDSLYRMVLQGAGMTGRICPIITRDGRKREIEWHVKRLLDTDARQVGVLAIGQDVTERTIMEKELLKAAKLESLGVLAGGIAHDFNNLLTVIMGNISLALTQLDSPGKVKEFLAKSEKASFRAQDLTRQLLTFAKGGAPVKTASSIATVIRESAGFAMRGSSVRCEFSISSDLWPVDIDAGQISQVLHNLFINANQAMPAGGVIQTHCENVVIGPEEALPLQAGRYVKVSIIDQGVGIPEENLGKVFDPYFTTKAQGSGLGLASSFSIVTQHGGTITVESAEGRGTTFHIFLPASSKELRQKQVRREAVAPACGRILVMDDEEEVRDVIGNMLRSAGYEVEFAQGGEEAIDRYKESLARGCPFDVLIMDLTIPGRMGGKEAIAILRQINPQVKAIVSTGYSNDSVMANFREYGFDELITKPFKVAELTEKLRLVLAGGP